MRDGVVAEPLFLVRLIYDAVCQPIELELIELQFGFMVGATQAETSPNTLLLVLFTVVMTTS